MVIKTQIQTDNIGPDTILAVDIAPRAINFVDEMQTIATSTILGRKTAAAGNIEELSPTDAKTVLAIAQADVSGLTTASSPSFVGATLSGMMVAGIVHNAVTTGILTSSKIVDADVDNSAAIALSKLATQANNTIVGNIAGSPAVPTALSGANVRTITGLATGDSPSFTGLTLSGMATAGIVHNAVTTGILTSSKIVDADVDNSAAIALSKLATQAAYTIVGNNTASPAVPTALSAANTKTLLAIAQADVSGLTTSDSPTFNGQVITEATTITAIPANTKVSGTAITLKNGSVAMAFGEVGYIYTNGKVEKAKAAVTVTPPAMVMCAEAAGLSTNTSGKWLLLGTATYNSWSWGTVGGLIYLNTVAGSMTQSAPALSTKVVQILGVATSATSMIFNPSPIQVEIA